LAKIAFINTPHPERYRILSEGRDISRYFHFVNRPNRPPIDLAYMAAVARSVDDETELSLIEANSERMSVSEAAKSCALLSPEIVVVNTSAFDRWICPYPSLYQPSRLFDALRERLPEALLVAVGPHIGVFPETSMQEMPSADVGIMGEPEDAFRDILERTISGEGIAGVQGCVVRSGSSLEVSSARPPIKDLDSLPLPYYEMSPFSVYSRYGYIKSELYDFQDGSSFILGSRGCPYSCTYCALYIHGRRFRSRSPSSILDEIKILNSTYGIRVFRFQDPEFAVDTGRAMRICELLSDEGLGVRWSAEMRYDSADPELLEAMKSAGCYHISYGLESGSQKVLDAVNKRETVEGAEETIRATSRLGIHSSNNVLIGLPGESEDTVQETVDFVSRLSRLPRVTFARASLPVYYPETKLYSAGVQEGEYPAIERWADFGEVLSKSGLVLTEFETQEEVIAQVDRYDSVVRELTWANRYGERYALNPRFYLAGLGRVKRKLAGRKGRDEVPAITLGGPDT